MCVWALGALWVSTYFGILTYFVSIVQNNKGWTALHCTSRNGHVSLARDLIAMYRLHPNTPDKVWNIAVIWWNAYCLRLNYWEYCMYRVHMNYAAHLDFGGDQAICTCIKIEICADLVSSPKWGLSPQYIQFYHCTDDIFWYVRTVLRPYNCSVVLAHSK